MTRSIEAILDGARLRGEDCTEAESVAILSYFDVWHPEREGAPVALWFPLEADQWTREREEGSR